MEPPSSDLTWGLEVLGRNEQTLGGSGPGPMFLQVGQELGHYRLEAPLGAGGFGRVWKARDLRLERTVAVKLLGEQSSRSPAARALLEAEARTIATLDHPGVVVLHALEEAEGQLFLVMERIQGRTLARVLDEGPLPLSRLMDLALQATDALGAAHRQGIVHRDLNPRNLMLTEGGRVKILDFGLALRQASREPEPAVRQSGGLTGTVPYMSPEQLEGRALDARTDIFSLGVVLYELGTGERPFRGETIPALVEAILHATPSWPEHLPEGLLAVLRRCLAKDPAHRYASGLELHQALQRVQGGGPVLPSVAVLPFRDLSPHQDEGHFCEGMAEEVLLALSRAPGLRLVSRSASFPYRDTALEAGELGRRLGVATLLSGSVRKAGTRLRISVELTDAASGLSLWEARFDRERADAFQLQDEMAVSIASALRLRLLPKERPRPSVDPEAYEDYLRGRQWYYRYNRHGMRFALQMFQQTLEREPRFAPAWAGVATCAAFLFTYAERTETHRLQADEASAQALALDPTLAEAHASRGVALSASGRTEEAEAAFREARRLDPNLYEAAYFHARHCLALGDLLRAAEAFEDAICIRPEDFQAPLLVAQVYGDLGRAEEATATRRRGLARVEERLRQAPDDTRARYFGANALMALGERDRAMAWARMARALDPGDAMLLYNLGCIHALGGEPETALDCLEEAVEAGLSQKGWILHDGDLASLRSLPRFQALVERLD